MSRSQASLIEREGIDLANGTAAGAVASFRHIARGLNMTQLRRDAAYIRTKSHERSAGAHAAQLSQLDEQVLQLLSTAHTVKSAAKTLSRPSETSAGGLEDQVAESMQRLLQAERIQLSPDS
jgi:hypothetical protein